MSDPIQFRYKLPWPPNFVLRMEEGDESDMLTTSRINHVLTDGRAPLHVVLEIQALEEGERYKARRGVEKVRFTRERTLKVMPEAA